MATSEVKELRAELDAVKEQFLEFRQAVENTFSASRGTGLGIEFARQLRLLRGAPAETTPEVTPPLPSTGPTVEEAAVLKATVTEMLADARATLPLLSLDEALKIAKGEPYQDAPSSKGGPEQVTVSVPQTQKQPVKLDGTEELDVQDIASLPNFSF
jgi:hypothetical protein